MPNLTEAERRDIGLTIAGEIDPRQTPYDSPQSRNEIASILGVIDNRAKINSPATFGKTAPDAKTAYRTLSDVVRQPSQFSTWNDVWGKQIAAQNYAKYKAQIDNAVSDYFDTGLLTSPVPNATHYWAPAAMAALTGSASPYWGGAIDDKTRVGAHVFGIQDNLPTALAKAKEFASNPPVPTQKPANLPGIAGEYAAYAASRMSAPAKPIDRSTFADKYRSLASSLQQAGMLGLDARARPGQTFAAPVTPVTRAPLSDIARIAPLSSFPARPAPDPSQNKAAAPQSVSSFPSRPTAPMSPAVQRAQATPTSSSQTAAASLGIRPAGPVSSNIFSKPTAPSARPAAAPTSFAQDRLSTLSDNLSMGPRTAPAPTQPSFSSFPAARPAGPISPNTTNVFSPAANKAYVDKVRAEALAASTPSPVRDPMDMRNVVGPKVSTMQPLSLPAVAKPTFAPPVAPPVAVARPPVAVQPRVAVARPASPVSQPAAPSFRPSDIYDGRVGSALASDGSTVARDAFGNTSVTNSFGVTTTTTPGGRQTFSGFARPTAPASPSAFGAKAKAAAGALAGAAVGSMVAGPVGGIIGGLLGRQVATGSSAGSTAPGSGGGRAGGLSGMFGGHNAGGTGSGRGGGPSGGSQGAGSGGGGGRGQRQ